MVGANDEPRVLVCIDGAGELLFDGQNYSLDKGDVMLLPACSGICNFRPIAAINLLEIGIPGLIRDRRLVSII